MRFYPFGMDLSALPSIPLQFRPTWNIFSKSVMLDMTVRVMLSVIDEIQV